MRSSETTPNKNFELYVIHHSHTDIGYTDLQEIIVYKHIKYIRDAIGAITRGYQDESECKDFVWNCETSFCVEKFLEDASSIEQDTFFSLVKKKNIGISATYLNFTDLVDQYILRKKLISISSLFKDKGIHIRTAMNADVNGISLGSWDAYLDAGVEFLYTNIHCHHGMYPLFQNQTPYFWEAKNGQRILVWNGEHYNLGNLLGLVENKHLNFLSENYLGKATQDLSHIEKLHNNISEYITQCKKSGYPYNFIPTCVSGVFSDNAPPNTEIIHTIKKFNTQYDDIKISMLSLDELYEKIKPHVQDAPVYKGDLNDWWAHGVSSTPQAVTHYKEAQRKYHVCRELNVQYGETQDKLLKTAEDNLLLFAEHTWGHSASISDPCLRMANNLDLRNYSYASKAHEATTENFIRILNIKGDSLDYYSRAGRFKAVFLGDTEKICTFNFYLEVWKFGDIEIIDESNNSRVQTQVSPHPRGVELSIISNFKAREEKIFRYQEIESKSDIFNSRIAYMGSERVKDIINTYDNEYSLMHCLENDYFKLEYSVQEGFKSFYNKIDKIEMLKQDTLKFFTPIYEITPLRNGNDPYEERRLLGRNIRGAHAKQSIARLQNIRIREIGDIFNVLVFEYSLESCKQCDLEIKFYHQEARIDFALKIAKSLEYSPESIYLPLELDFTDAFRYIDKSNVSFRPGIDQVPGTCMEYYLLDNGIVYQGKHNSILLSLLDAPLIYHGSLEHHPIQLCDNKEENNFKPIYSWIMNNLWETNFKIDLSGCYEFRYELRLTPSTTIEDSFDLIKLENLGVQSFSITTHKNE